MNCSHLLQLCSETDKKLRELDYELRDLTADLQNLMNKQNQLEEEKFELDADVDRQGSKVSTKEAEYQVLMKDYEYAKEREAVLMGDR